MSHNRSHLTRLAVAAFAMFTLVLGAAGTQAADETFKADPVHSMVIFRAHHVGAGYVWGRFNDPAGTFQLDADDQTKSTFSVEIPVNDVDTHNDKRDAHLKSPDFFNAKEYPNITFKSSAVKAGKKKNILEVTGDLSIHGVTKSVTVPVELTGTGEFPKGTKRAGIEAEFHVKLSDYEIKGLPGAVADEIKVIVAMEGIGQ